MGGIRINQVPSGTTELPGPPFFPGKHAMHEARGGCMHSFVPDGTLLVDGAVFPALKRWAILSSHVGESQDSSQFRLGCLTLTGELGSERMET